MKENIWYPIFSSNNLTLFWPKRGGKIPPQYDINAKIVRKIFVRIALKIHNLNKYVFSCILTFILKN